ncbi:MAG: DNA polymerase [bacterium]
MSEKIKKQRIILLDAHAIIHRAYHALPDFSNSSGEPTGALYGIATMLMKIVTDLKPDYVIACYDLPQKTFRHEAYKDYKAGRQKADENLVKQIISSRRIFETLNIPIYDAPGFEADDILGTIVEETKKDKSVEIVIASGDMDTLQLVEGKRVQVFTLKKGINDTVIYDENAVVARFGFVPKLLPDYKGLRGDPSDNIIGIVGIGEKTATDLIGNFGTIENLYKTLKKNPESFVEIGIKPRMIELLKNGEEEALFSKTLATIRRDAPIAWQKPEKTFLENIEIEKVEEMFREFEFRSLINRVRTVFGGAASAAADAAPRVELVDSNPDETKRLAIAMWLLNSDLTNVTYEDVIHYGGSKNFDDARTKILHDIKEKNLSFVYEKIELPIISIVDGMEKYGIRVDTNMMQRLSEEGHKQLSAVEKTIWQMAGREFNVSSPKQLGEVLFDELKVGEGTGTRMKKTEGGARSTRESELQKLQGMHPIIDQIFVYRELSKLLSTYIDTLPALVGEDGRLHASFIQAGTTTGRFSSQNPNLQNIPTENNSVAGQGKKIREAFIADKGYKFIAFDYSQIELRIAALLSCDEFLIQVFKDGKDIHSAVASRVFGVSVDAVTADMRRKAKVINFGILYGMGVTALQQNLGGTRKEAQEFYDSYFKSFPKIAGYMDSITEFAKANGYTETLFGRRRYFGALKSPLPFMRAMAERQAGNAPIQGTATADCIKLAISDAHEALQKAGLVDKVHLVLQVHDELVYEVEEKEVEKVSKLVEEAMKNVIKNRPEFLKGKSDVPLEVHVAVGNNWGELK